MPATGSDSKLSRSASPHIAAAIEPTAAAASRPPAPPRIQPIVGRPPVLGQTRPATPTTTTTEDQPPARLPPRPGTPSSAPTARGPGRASGTTGPARRWRPVASRKRWPFRARGARRWRDAWRPARRGRARCAGWRSGRRSPARRHRFTPSPCSVAANAGGDGTPRPAGWARRAPCGSGGTAAPGGSRSPFHSGRNSRTS